MGEMAKKISNVDNKKLLEALNAALAEEWLAYYQYWAGATVMVGPMRPTVQEEFEKHANEEKGHADKVAERIVQLGGTPVLDPAEWSKLARCKYDVPPANGCIVKLINQNIHAERCAIQRYQEICDMTFGKDHETYHMAREILSDELEHENDLEDFATDIELIGGCKLDKK